MHILIWKDLFKTTYTTSAKSIADSTPCISGNGLLPDGKQSSRESPQIANWALETIFSGIWMKYNSFRYIKYIWKFRVQIAVI